MKYRIYIFLLALGLSDLAGEEIPANEYCPVTPSDLAEADIYTSYKGERVYFCCKSCLRDFLKDPESYLGNLEKADVEGNAEKTSVDVRDRLFGQAMGESTLATSDHSATGDHTHDHSEHDPGNSGLKVLYGKLHVVMIHFPIALIPFAGLAEILFLIRRTPLWTEVSKVSFLSGTVAAVIAATMGWIAADLSNYPDSLESILFSHRWLGVFTAILAAVGAGLLYLTTGLEKTKCWLRPVVILSLSLLVLITAHFGGSLIYGPDYLF